jgi:hypothetical protein
LFLVDFSSQGVFGGIFISSNVGVLSGCYSPKGRMREFGHILGQSCNRAARDAVTETETQLG